MTLSQKSSPRGRIIVISGPSGVGKTSVCKALCQEFSQLEWSVSATTRPMRAGEVMGRDYYFLSKEEFNNKIEAGEFIEYAEVHGRLYGTLRSHIEKTLDNGHHCLVEIDVQGAKKIRAQNIPNTLFVFIAPPDLQEIKNRLQARGSNAEDEIIMRLNQANAEMAEAKIYDYHIVNVDLAETVSKLKDLISPLLKI